MKRMVRFLSDFWWFLCRWHPVSIKWRSPRILWRMAMRREQIKAAVLRGRARIEADEANAHHDGRLDSDVPCMRLVGGDDQ